MEKLTSNDAIELQVLASVRINGLKQTIKQSSFEPGDYAIDHAIQKVEQLELIIQKLELI